MKLEIRTQKTGLEKEMERREGKRKRVGERGRERGRKIILKTDEKKKWMKSVLREK